MPPSATAPQINQFQQSDKIKRALEAIFVTAFDHYEAQTKKNQISLNLKKLSLSHFTETATEATQLELDTEPGADRKQLKDLVRKQAKEENKAMQREIDKLSNKLKALESKNTERGQKTSGASKKKQIQQQKQKSSQSQKEKTKKKGNARRSAPAGESSNDSEGNKRGKKKPNKGARKGRT